MKKICLSLTGLVLSFSLGSARAAEPASRTIALNDFPLLFADNSGIAASSGLTRTVHPARTRNAPVLVPEKPWEGGRVYVYGSVYYDEPSRLLRLWYMSRTQAERGGTKVVVPTLHGDLDLYATSEDGVHWTRPPLGLHACDGSSANNIVFGFHSPSVLLDRHEQDPLKRYKMLGAHAGNYHAAYSPDGLHWTNYSKSPVLEHSDTITLSQNPATGEYLAYHKRPAKVRGFGRRVVWLATSRDFQTWSEPELVMAPDAEDDTWATNAQQRTEIYNMSVYPHAAGFVGLPAMFRITEARRPKEQLTVGQSPDDGPIDIQLATSADGHKWERTTPRVNLIPRGAPGSFDAGAILGVTSTMVHVGDETWVYYTAINTGHGGPIPPKRLTIGRAEWRRHGMASLDAGAARARLETLPLKLCGSKLLVNADAAQGEVRAALLEADGRPIAGFALTDNEPLNQNATRSLVQWKGKKEIPQDRPVKVLLELTNAKLFSLACEK